MKKGKYTGKDIYFAVIGIHNRKHNFSSQKIAEEVLRELGDRSQTVNEMELYCYCLMPTALHMIFSLSDMYKKDTRSWVTSLKRRLSRNINRLFGVKIEWEKGYKLEPVNDENDFNRSLNMLLDTPVNEGVVSQIRDFKYSRFIKKP
jgi:hypothetical protein